MAWSRERDRTTHVDPENAWHDLFEGRWRVTDRIDGGTHETVICSRSEGNAVVPLFSSRVLRLVHRRARGASVKELALESSRTSSSVSLTLTRTKAKLKLRNDAALVALFGGSESGGRVPPAPGGLEAWIEGEGGGRRLCFRSPAWPWISPVALSAGERQVLDDLLSGGSDGAIARARGRSVRTVSNQIASIFSKIGVRSRIELFVSLREGGC